MPEAPSVDRELLRQLAKGSQAAFTTLYERFQGPIYRFAWHMSGNSASAEEAVQEVFLRLIGKPKGYDPTKGSLAGYLFGIARNVLRGNLDQGQIHLPLIDELSEGDDPELADDGGLLEELDRRERLECLRKSVLALPEPYREALVLCDLQEMSYDEAGTILQCPPGTVASRLHRARSMVKSRMKEMGCAR